MKTLKWGQNKIILLAHLRFAYTDFSLQGWEQWWKIMCWTDSVSIGFTVLQGHYWTISLLQPLKIDKFCTYTLYYQAK